MKRFRSSVQFSSTHSQLPPVVYHSPEGESTHQNFHFAKPTRNDGASNLLSKFPLSEKRFQYKVIQLLSEIKSVANSHHFQCTCKAAQDDNLLLLLNTVKEFDDFENKIFSNEDVFNLLVNQISRVGGANYKTSIKSIMQLVMSNSLRANFSMAGKRGQKKAFEKTKFYHAVFDSDLATYAESTRSTVRDFLKDYLKYAPDRLNGGGCKSSPRTPG
ncbi:uncharacterized protein LOC136090107 [Hydra vulgaris]|uniref:Uncharacterized protein LOC136090107 n=1 Tax=Hydra vulgaris TaxID=6087 RepID=A0ABM4DD03_HYDVU